MNLEDVRKIPPRVLIILLGGIGLLMMVMTYTLLLQKPFAEYLLLKKNSSRLAAKVEENGQMTVAIKNYEAQGQSLARELLGGSSGYETESAMVAHIIGSLDKLCRKHRMKLISVRPGVSIQIQMFEEVPFDIEVQGTYFDMYAWLHELEEVLGPMVLKHFALQPVTNDAEQLKMELKMVAYKPAARKEG